MIRNIMFDGKSGYIGSRYTKDDKPERPDRHNYEFRHWDFERHEDVFDEEKFSKKMEKYEADMKFYKEHLGKYKVGCSENLVGRTFTFDPHKINLIFGPNASGKSTILKGIASHAFCNDGFSKFLDILDLDGCGLEPPTPDKLMSDLKRHIKEMYHLSTIVEWDGSPIYFHNFENRKSYGYIGDLTGSILGSISDEIAYLWGKGRISSGQNSFYQFTKLVGIMSRTVTYEDILAGPKAKYGKYKKNDIWRMCYDVQEEYYKSFPMSYDRSGQNTYLFDEIDKSMDIINIGNFYRNVLPAMSEKYGQQIIVISHSPVVLKDDIYGSDRYNFISMDENYTKECRRLMFG